MKRAPIKRKTRLKPVSAKKRARKSREASEGAREHMAHVAALPCLVCGAWPVEVHHEGTPRSDWRVLPLCARHHRREYGPGARHYSPKAFFAAHGTASEMLAQVAEMIGETHDKRKRNNADT
jgi:hypothetical protein